MHHDYSLTLTCKLIHVPIRAHVHVHVDLLPGRCACWPKCHPRLGIRVSNQPYTSMYVSRTYGILFGCLYQNLVIGNVYLQWPAGGAKPVHVHVHEIQDTLHTTTTCTRTSICKTFTIHLGSYTCIPGTPTGTAEPGHHQRRQTLPGFFCARCGAAVVILGRTDRTKSAARSVSVTWRSRLARKCASC